MMQGSFVPVTKGHSPVIAYTFIAFPSTSETFFLREILELQKLGMRVELLSLLRPSAKHFVHPESRSLSDLVHYGPWFFSSELWASNFLFLCRSPRIYLRLLGQLASGSWKNPMEFAKALAIFPKSVYFARLVQRLGVQHVHATFASHTATCARIISELTGIDYSVAAHAYDIFFEKPLLRYRLAKARFIATISDFNVRLIHERYGTEAGSRTRVVRCGVDLALYPRRATPEVVVPHKLYTYICVASLLPVKGHKFLLEALARLKSEGRSMRCVLVGDGPLHKDLGRRISVLGLQEIVHMVGSQSQGEVSRWLQQADCFVLASLREGVPVSIMEGMACELPIVATDTGRGIAELVEHGRSGLLVPPRDVEALAGALALIQDHPALARAYGLSGRQTVEEHYDIAKNAKILWGLFMESCRHSSERGPAAPRGGEIPEV